MKWGDVQRSDRGEWVTLLQGAFYPDVLEQAAVLYAPVLARFRELLGESDSATDLYRRIMREPNPSLSKPRNKLVAMFRRYFTDVSTENLGKQNQVEDNIRHYGPTFRDIEVVRQNFSHRPFPDETLMGILYLNAQRGKTGYSLTDLFFEWFEAEFEGRFKLSGPRGSGKDLNLHTELVDYAPQTKADLLIRNRENDPLVVGFARYDAHRGGSQEDDRIMGNNDNLTDVMEYSARRGRALRVLFLNHGPGLTAGSMWNDYAALDQRWEPNVIVATLKMLLFGRLTTEWIEGA